MTLASPPNLVFLFSSGWNASARPLGPRQLLAPGVQLCLFARRLEVWHLDRGPTTVNSAPACPTAGSTKTGTAHGRGRPGRECRNRRRADHQRPNWPRLHLCVQKLSYRFLRPARSRGISMAAKSGMEEGVASGEAFNLNTTLHVYQTGRGPDKVVGKAESRSTWCPKTKWARAC